MLTMLRLMLTMLRLILTMSSFAHNGASHAHNLMSHAHNVTSHAHNVASHAHNVTSHAHNVASCSQCRLVLLKIFLARQDCEHEIECVYALTLHIGKAGLFYIFLGFKPPLLLLLKQTLVYPYP